jgi:hypothetical protein
MSTTFGWKPWSNTRIWLQNERIKTNFHSSPSKPSEDLDDYLNKTERSFRLFREKRAKLSRRLKACMKPFLALSSMVSAAVSASPFAPASAVLGAVCFILQAAEDVSEIYD